MPNFLKLITLTSFVAMSSAAIADSKLATDAAEVATDAVTDAAAGAADAVTDAATGAAEAVTDAASDAVTDAATGAADAVADTATSDSTPTEGEATTENPDGLSMGEEVVDENKPGTTYVVERFGDWELRCVRVPEGQKEPCQLFQLLSDDAGNAIAEVNFLSLTDGGQAVAGATIVAPLETLLTKQLTMSVDGGAKKRYPFSFCSGGGCYSQIGLTNGDVASFKRGAAASITIVPAIAPTETVTVKMSLTGFTKAYAALKERD